MLVFTHFEIPVSCLLKTLKLKLSYDRPVCLGVGSHLEPMIRLFFSVWQLRVSWREASSLTRRWVCNLLIQWLMSFSRAVTLGSKSRRTRDHILLSRWRPSQPGEPGPRMYITQEQGGPVIHPGTGFPFRRHLRLARLRWKYSNPPPRERQKTFPMNLLYNWLNQCGNLDHFLALINFLACLFSTRYV
jgi:hypothetical protein